jgi:hypothetical protein
MARRVISVTTLFVWAAFTTYAEQPEDLRQQLEQLKQEYQQKITDLEQRIAALEKQRSQPSVPTQGASLLSSNSLLWRSRNRESAQRRLPEASCKIVFVSSTASRRRSS